VKEPLIGKEEEIWVWPLHLPMFSGGVVYIEVNEEDGMFSYQPRVWWEPIEDEE